MEKFRVYELAKELNTTSKRLMEKLSEIKIEVKNHMSLLSDEELKSLYKHIGIIDHSEEKKAEAEAKKNIQATPPSNTEVKKEVKKDIKSAPRIIRKTEIIIDTKDEYQDTSYNDKYTPQKSNLRGDVRNNPSDTHKQDFVRKADSNSGLRAGYIRDTKPVFTREQKQPEVVQHAHTDAVQHKTEITSEVQKTEIPIEVQKVEEISKEAALPKEIITAKEDEVTTEVKKKRTKKADAKPEQPSEEVTNVDETAKEVVVPDTEKVVKAGGDKKKDEKINKELATSDSSPAVKSSETEAKPFVSGSSTVSRPPYSSDRPNTSRPSYSSDRPNTASRPPYNSDRPNTASRPPYNSDRPNTASRPPYNSDRPNTASRPPYNSDRPNTASRPPYNSDRPNTGTRPPYSSDRPNTGTRPPYNSDRPNTGTRPPYNSNRPNTGDRPYNNRPSTGDRPNSGNYDNRQGSRPSGDRNQGNYRPGNKSLEIPKVELTAAQKEEVSSQRSEVRREFQNKDFDKDIKREQKREVPKGQAAAKDKRINSKSNVVGQTKGVSEVLSEDFILNEFYSDDGSKRVRRPNRQRREPYKAPIPRYIPPKAVLTLIKVPEQLTVKDLAESLKKTSTEVIKKLMALGMMVTLNNELDFDTATIVAGEFGVKTEKEIVINEEDILFDDSEDSEEDLVARPPVVVVMGHVDHGKTSLLDAIRQTNVIESESGGITQHIGAYMITINNRNITFLDTPGHEAFTAMRARGAQITDIAILVVAADDGVMPQTIEAINHAKAAKVTIIVAINKIDKPGADIERIKQELTEYNLVAEEWGGDTIFVPVSAKQKTNIDHLLEMVLLAADMQELKANPNRQAKGTIIEAKLDKGRGPVATVLVQRGTLNVGDSVVTGTTVGRIRDMLDDKGHKIKKAGPSCPVEIVGLPNVPEAGEIFYAITDERIAKQLAEKRKNKLREENLKASAKVSLDDLYNQIIEGKVKDLNLIVKADVQGSVEAVKQSLAKLNNGEVRVNIIHGGVGAISEHDVTLAQVSNAIIIGFNVRPGVNVAETAKNVGVDLRFYKVIYNAIEDIQAAMKGMLEPTFKEVIQGHAEIRQIIKVSGVGSIAGCYVTDGKVTRSADVRIVRDGIVVHEGKLSSLKRFKDDAKEVAQGFECGAAIDHFNEIKENDVIESFFMEQIER